MKRAIELALFVVLCHCGILSATARVWGPKARLCPEDVGGTATNNTRCVTGTGDTIQVAFERLITVGQDELKSIWYMKSADIGHNWTEPFRLDDDDLEVSDSSSFPSLVKLGEFALGAVFVQYKDNIGKVWTRATTSGTNENWGDLLRATTDAEPYADKPSAFSYQPADQDAPPRIEVAWNQIGSGGIRARKGHRPTGYDHLIWDARPKDPATGSLNPTGASIYCSTDDSAGCAWWSQCTGGGATVYYNRRKVHDDDWPSCNLDIGASVPGIPSIAYLTEGKHELVAFEMASGYPAGIHIERRTLEGGDTTWHGNAYYGYGALGDDELIAPNVYGSGDTFYMVYARRHGESGSPVDVYFTFSTDYGETWLLPNKLNRGCDRATICVRGGHGYLAYTKYIDDDTYPVAQVGHLRVAAIPPGEERAEDGFASSRRLVGTPGTEVLHRVYTFANFINYERSDDNGETWDCQSAPDFGTNPTLALHNGSPYISYLRSDSVFCAVLNADSEWTIKTLYAALSGQHLGSPSLTVFPNGSGRIGNAVFPCYDSATASSMILYCQFDTTGGAYSLMLDTLDYSSGKYNDSAACIAVGLSDTVSVCYSTGDSVFARTLFYPPTDNSRPNPWCSASLVGSGGSVSTYHPSCERIGNRLWVAYSERVIDAVTGDTSWAIMRTSCEAADTGIAITWEGTAAVSSTDGYVKDFPSLATAKTVAWAESSGTHWTIKASVDDSILSLTPGDTNCKFVSICADTAVQSTPSTSSTGICYTWLQQYSGDGDTWAVHYVTKSVLTSDADANVTMYNQGRKIVLDHDTTFVVYTTDAGSVRIAKKKDGDEGWTSSLLSNSGDVPALDVDYASRIYACERLFDNSGGAGTYDVIRCQTRAAGSEEWTNFQVYASARPALSTQHKLSPPAIAACLSDPSEENLSAAYIIFAVYEPGANGTTTICMAKVNTTGVVYIDTLRKEDGHNDSFPDIALHPETGEQSEGYVIHASFQAGTEVYVKKTREPDQPQYTSKCGWYSDYNLSNTAANSRHAKLAASADTVLVAWVEGDSGVIYVKGQGPGSDYDAWDSPVNVSACPDTVCDQPSVTIAESTIVTYHKKLSATNYDIIARVNFNSNLNISNTATKASKYPHCVFHFHNDSFPVISTVWTEELSTNYAEVGYKRWQLGEANGGGIQNAGFIDPNIRPCLFAPSPNPFTGQTSIRYATNIKGMTRVSIMDITGRRVRNLLTMPQNPGIYNLTWNARDDRARQLPRGVYFVRLETANYSEARKVVLE